MLNSRKLKKEYGMKSKILLAMSGGVDSSVAIALLQEKYQVIGVTFRFFDDFDPSSAKSVSERFGIEHYVIDRREDFKSRVVRHFCDSWLTGQTPNVCTHCNKVMKFPALFDAADALSCESAATGHYARTVNGVLKQAILENGDINPKDQSYMLYTLTSEQLRRIVFPLGELNKSQVREIAAEHGLVNASQPDSMDICFIPDGDYAGFIERFTGEGSQIGDFVNKSSEIIGKHKGHIHYTTGQRRGLGISSHERLFVIRKDAKSNTVTVGSESDLFVTEFYLENLIWHVENPPAYTTVKTRYSFAKYGCRVDGNRVVFDEPQKNVTSGQCAVFYDKDAVIGGGIII
jgi:tRNA-specific 2-thiouridylase